MIEAAGMGQSAPGVEQMREAVRRVARLVNPPVGSKIAGVGRARVKTVCRCPYRRPSRRGPR